MPPDVNGPLVPSASTQCSAPMASVASNGSWWNWLTSPVITNSSAITTLASSTTTSDPQPAVLEVAQREQPHRQLASAASSASIRGRASS